MSSAIRMLTRSIKLGATLTVCLGALVLLQGRNNHAQGAPKDGMSIDDLRNYRKMFRVNQKPIDMVEGTKLMCASPATQFGPHYDPGVVYYINETARQALTAYAEKKVFPVGSIIVKEKQERKTEDSVQIITVMKKVLAGSTEDSWEYKMYDTTKWAEIEFSKGVSASNKTCIGCHRRYKDNDYVSDRGVELLLRR